MKFTYKVTGKANIIKGGFSCNSKNVIYLMSCDKCEEECIGSAVNFKPYFRVHKGTPLWYL